jgi:mono/diheme cytochrome c family protein
MPLKLFSRFLVFVFIILSLTACISLAEDVTPPPGYQAPTAPQNTATAAAPVYPVLPPDTARGEPLYLEKCAPCHGDSGLGDGPDAEMLSNPVAPLGDPALARLAAPDDWYLMVTKGNMQNFMPPFASLSVPERWDVIAYSYMLSTTPEEVTQGSELYAANCASCHGVSGEGDGPEAGALSISPVDFTNQEFMGSRSATDLFDSITNGLGEMHSYADLSEQERWALTAFLRTLTFAETELEPEVEATETPAAASSPDPTPTLEDSQTDAPEVQPPETITGTVNIEVVTASEELLPSDMEVILFAYEGMTQIYSRTLVIPEQGFVSVDDVPMLEENFIFATMDYDGIVYGSEISVVETDANEINLAIPFYEKSSDPSVLKADRLHIFFDFVNEDTVQIFALYIFSNLSNQVLAAETTEEAAVVFNLPEGAMNLQRDTGMEFQDIDLPNGFGLLSVYPSPEPYQVLYSFELPYEKDKTEFDLPIGLDTTAVIVMSPENGVRIKSDQLIDAGMRDIEGVSYNIYNGSSLRMGDDLQMAVSGRPKMASMNNESVSSTTSTSLVIGLAVFGVVLIGSGIYLWQRNRHQDEEIEDDADGENPEDMMDAIIALDELYEAGEIPRDAYQKRRHELKERLRELVGS